MQFKKDIIDLFSGKKGGHVQKWLYSDHLRPDNRSGATLWHNFVTTNKDYYIIREEIKVIPSIIEKLRSDYDTVVEFGIGDRFATENKTVPILKSQKNLQKYYAIDISEDNLTTGFTVINEHINNIETIGIADDFYKRNDTIQGENRLGLCLGATISNQDMRIGKTFPKKRIVEQLNTLGNTIKGNKQGNLIISIDTNPDLQSALQSYQHPAWINMMTGLMYDVKDILKPKGDFTPSLWHYTPVIDKDNHVLHQAISPNSDQHFSIDGHEFNIKRGEHFVVKNNFKYPYELFIEMSKEASLTPETSSATNKHYNVVILNAQA